MSGMFSFARVAALISVLSFAPPASAFTSHLYNSDATGNALARFDVDGNALDAHDGGLVQFGQTYYLYGTSYACGYEYKQNSSFCGFKVYSSPDLWHWTDKGFAVPAGNCAYCFRPHVIYNAATKTYVMWTDAGGVYAVYASASPTGPFTRQPNPTLAVGGAVDEALFQDDDGTGWLIHNTTGVAAGLTADMVVEKLTADYLNTTGQNAKLGLGDVEGFAVFKRGGKYHALMSDPSCAYCSGATGEMTATSMLGPWEGKWYDSAGVHQSGRTEPRWRARIVNPDNCGGQPLATPAIAREDGTLDYYFVSDRWKNRAPNEALADFFIGRMEFAADGTLKDIRCADTVTASLRDGSLGAYKVSARFDQGSGFEGFRHYCDIAGKTERRQSFAPSRSGRLMAVSVTSFQGGRPDAPLILDILDGAGAVLKSATFALDSIPWAPHVLTAHPDVDVQTGSAYFLRLRSATTQGCYGWEYNDANPYPRGFEAYSTDGGATYTAESGRDLKFTVDVEGTTSLAGLARRKPDTRKPIAIGRDAAGRFRLHGFGTAPIAAPERRAKAALSSSTRP